MSKHAEAARIFAEAANRCAEAAKALGDNASKTAIESLKHGAYLIGELALGQSTDGADVDLALALQDLESALTKTVAQIASIADAITEFRHSIVSRLK